MTPSEFLQEYTEMDVFLIPSGGNVEDGDWTTVHAKKYHLGTSSYQQVLWQGVSSKVAKGAEVRVRTIEGKEVTTDVLNPQKLWWLFRFPFSGKGSPEQVQATIQLLYRFRSNKSTVEQFAGGEGGQNEYNFIGLDCNGFVGNYLQRVAWQKYDWLNQNNVKDPGPDSLIKPLFLDSTDPIYEMSDFGSGDQSIYIFAFCSPDGHIYDHGDGPGGAGHIMITDPGINWSTGTEIGITVSESTAADINGSKGGPVTSEYIIKGVTQKGNTRTKTGAVFSVWRGGDQNLEMKVKIGRVK
jgi:hypothetical protein